MSRTPWIALSLTEMLRKSECRIVGLRRKSRLKKGHFFLWGIGMRIILFDIDSLRSDHLGCYGYSRPTSPNIDAVARQGVRFTNYFCADGPCLPSRMGFVSGRFGIHNGVVSNAGAGARFNIRTKIYGGPLPENDMLYRNLRKAGLDSISFSNFADRHSAMWFVNGWSEYHTINLKSGGESASEIHEKLMPWLKANARREDYILHINYWDTHRVYRTAESWTDRFKDHPVPQAWPDEETIRKHQSATALFSPQAQFHDGVSTAPLMPGTISNRSDFEKLITGYDASIAYVDHHLGIVLEELKNQGVLDDAAIIITSDHGESFGEHGVYATHICADDCVNRIPLVIKWPGVAPAGGVCDSLLYNVDLAATLCELQGAEIPKDWDGRSFAANLRDEPGLERDFIVFGHALCAVQRAVRTKSRLMIRTYDPLAYSLDPVELYDIESDPYQTRNLRDECPEIVNQFDHNLNEWLHEQLTKDYAIEDPFQTVLGERAESRLRKENPYRGPGIVA